MVISNIYLNSLKRRDVAFYTGVTYVENLSRVYPAVDWKEHFPTAVADPAFAEATVVFWVERNVNNTYYTSKYGTQDLSKMAKAGVHIPAPVARTTKNTVVKLFQSDYKMLYRLRDRRIYFVMSEGHIEINRGRVVTQSTQHPVFDNIIKFYRELDKPKLKVSVVQYELHKYLVSDYNMTTDKATKLIDSIKKQAALQDSAFTQRLNIYKSAFELSLPDKLSSEDKVLFTYLDFLSTVRYPEGLTDYIRSFYDIEEATVFTDALSKLTKGTVLIDPSSILEPEISLVPLDSMDRFTMKIKDLI